MQYDGNTMAATVFTKHAKDRIRERRGREGLTQSKVRAALRRPHQSCPDFEDPTCTEHTVRIKGVEWTVLTAASGMYDTAWLEERGVFLDRDDTVVITVHPR